MTFSPVDPCRNASLNLEAALDRVLTAIEPMHACEQVPIKGALGRILAESVSAPGDTPPFANSAMDGYAVSASDKASGNAEQETFTVVGSAYAGKPFPDRLAHGQCARIFTGAPVPEGTVAVVMQEEVELAGRSIRLKRHPAAGENIRPAGSDVRGGETVLSRGRLLQPADLGLLATFGIARLPVYQKPRVGYFSNGDELRGLGDSLAPSQIYDSNRYSLHGLLADLPVAATDLGNVPDDLTRLTELLNEAGRNFDLIISSGGASVGEKDLLRQALVRVGEINLWRIAIKPGKPLIFGRVGRAWYFGLPGNPVSAHVTFAQIVRPALWKLAGGSFRPLRLTARCQNDLVKTSERMEFQRGRLELDARGRLAVTGLAGQGSHQLAELSRANCFILLSAASHGARAGETVQVEPFSTHLSHG
ncbi:molybdopterin molybdotransferase MoeA [Methylohalobius crimeensis]|uniref:molybdopterin molybdotransferase MoeA n=1 Tax=Methylohalobius crimeensis TaxID=244365 RepID=UPI0003B40A0D|nr:gephyrin-like molybdotransferase Glp [Methylohalobius crimeensis]